MFKRNVVTIAVVLAVASAVSVSAQTRDLTGSRDTRSAASRGAKSVNKCMLIDEPGSYLVKKDLTAEGTCIEIASSFVTLDLGGHVLTGNGTGRGIEDTGSSMSVTIRNGYITGFEDGIFMIGWFARIERIHVIENSDQGIYSGGYGSVITNNVAGSNGDGIYSAGEGSTVSYNVAYDNDDGMTVPCPSFVFWNSVVGDDEIFSGDGCQAFNNLTE